MSLAIDPTSLHLRLRRRSSSLVLQSSSQEVSEWGRGEAGRKEGEGEGEGEGGLSGEHGPGFC